MVYTISSRDLDIKMDNQNDIHLDSKETNHQTEKSPRMLKNVILLGVAFMLHFTAFHGASNLQSSINAEEALGTFTLAAIYGSLIVSNLFLPAIVISWFGVKWTIVISFVAYMPFIMAQFSPSFGTLIPAALCVGLGGAPLWCAKCTYLTLGAQKSNNSSKNNRIIVKYFGLFFMFYQMAQVWGNLISSTVLTSGETTSSINFTHAANWSETCGKNFCPKTSVPDNSTPEPKDKIQLIAGIYLGCMVLAVLIVAFGVDSLHRSKSSRTPQKKNSVFQLLSVTIKHIKNKRQLLIIPITMFIGAEQAFLAADFNASYVACGWSVSHIGYVMICFGVSNAFFAFTIGSIAKIVGRNVIIVIALILHIAIIVGLLHWSPNAIETHWYFIVATAWGAVDAVWLIQINALSGILFPGDEEASFSNFRLWEASGSVLTYIISSYLCTEIKLYLLLSLLIVGVSGYFSVEFIERKNQKHFDVINVNEQLAKNENCEQLVRTNDHF